MDCSTPDIVPLLTDQATVLETDLKASTVEQFCYLGPCFVRQLLLCGLFISTLKTQGFPLFNLCSKSVIYQELLDIKVARAVSSRHVHTLSRASWGWNRALFQAWALKSDQINKWAGLGSLVVESPKPSLDRVCFTLS